MNIGFLYQAISLNRNTWRRIAALGKADEVRLPEGAQIMDAGGRFLIPGLWDMHIHSGSYLDFIKVQDALPRDLYFAVAAEAKRQGLPLAGHVPPSISALEEELAFMGYHTVE